MNPEKFDPSDPKYRKVEDLPEEERKNFEAVSLGETYDYGYIDRDLDAPGRGFVTQEAYYFNRGRYVEKRLAEEVKALKELVASGRAASYSEAEAIYYRERFDKDLASLIDFESTRRDTEGVLLDDVKKYVESIKNLSEKSDAEERLPRDLVRVRQFLYEDEEFAANFFNSYLEDYPEFMRSSLRHGHVLAPALKSLDYMRRVFADFRDELLGVPEREAYDVLEKYAQASGQDSGQPTAFLKCAVRTFLTTKMSQETAREFLHSSMSAILEPDAVINVYSQINDPDLLQQAVDRFSATDLSKVAVFGEQSVYRFHPDREEREKAAVQSLLSTFLERPNNTGDGDSDWRDVTDPLEVLSASVAAGVAPKNWREVVSHIEKKIRFLPSSYSGRVIGYRYDQLGESEVRALELEGGKFDGLKGEELEIKEGISGTKILFFDGHMVGGANGAVFSEQATNTNTVAWLTEHVIDSSFSGGLQKSYSIFGWRKGMPASPKILKEWHRWDSEGPFVIAPPSVTAKGEVVVSYIEKGEPKEERVEIPANLKLVKSK